MSLCILPLTFLCLYSFVTTPNIASFLTIYQYQNNAPNTVPRIFHQKYLHHPYITLFLPTLIYITNRFIHYPQLLSPITISQLNLMIQIWIPTNSPTNTPPLIFLKQCIIEPMYQSMVSCCPYIFLH